MILYHAADLIWATKIKGTAEALGLAARPVRSVEMLEARLADSPVRALVVDLDAPGIALALLRRLAERDKDAQAVRIATLAFGPHVAVELFQQAREAGAGTVMARGGFAARMASVLGALNAGHRVADAPEE